MRNTSSRVRVTEKVAGIISDAGGQVIGRTRLQKIVYLLEATRLGDGFEFEYRHYGPYSEDLTTALSIARVRGLVTEEEHPTNWGGTYSVYKSQIKPEAAADPRRKQLIETAASADPISLELAATAAFLAKEGSPHPWLETARRKPEKTAKLESAKTLYARLCAIQTPEPLPAIAD